MVSEVYHQGYVAKHLEVGAVVAAAPAVNVVRKRPEPGDVVILLGGRTGRDGIGGATGSSKSHNRKSLVTMASEVQKGNAPEERKIQRLFRNGDVTRLVKRCNDFGAGGVSVAIGELAPGLEIRLDAVRKKYEGLDGTELAISESQERMACVVAAKDAPAFIEAAEKENLEAYQVAVVTESPRMVMNWQGKTIVDLSRAFLDTNGASKHTRACAWNPRTAPPSTPPQPPACGNGLQPQMRLAPRPCRTLRLHHRRRFRAHALRRRASAHARAGHGRAAARAARTRNQRLLRHGLGLRRRSDERRSYEGAYRSVVTSVARLVAAGCDYRKAYLTLQEYFEKLRDEPERWGKPFAALLGALDAQLDLNVAAIGGQGLHVRLLPRHGRAPHPHFLCRSSGQNRRRALARIQGGRTPRLPARARLGRRRRLQGLLGRLCRPARRRQGEGRLGRGKQRGRSDHEHVVRQRHRL